MMQAEAEKFRRLGRAVETGFKQLEPFRRERGRLMAQYVGGHYGAAAKFAGANADRPLNMHYQTLQVLVPNLAYQNPKVRVRTPNIMLRPYAETFGLTLTHLARECNFVISLRDCIIDSMIGPMGIMKTGVCGDYQADMDQYTKKYGRVYIDRISPDHYVIDPAARCRWEADYEGHRFRAVRDDLLESGVYDNDAMLNLPTKTEDRGRYRTEELIANHGGPGSSDDRYEAFDYVELTELWLPKDGLIVTMAAPQGDDETLPHYRPVRVQEWKGPENGSLEILGFSNVPDSPVPLPWASVSSPLADAIDETASKVLREIKRSKSIMAYEGRAQEDAEAIREAEDGEAVRVDDIAALTNFEFGGVSDKNIEGLGLLIQQFSRQAGNVEQLGGIRSDAQTATQAEMLQANAGVRIDDMQQAVYAFAARVMRRAAWYLHSDPTIQLPMIKRIEGLDVEVVYSPETREGEFLDFHFEIEPQSMRRIDPAIKSRQMMDWARNVVLPSVEMAFMTHGQFNAGAMIRLTAQDMGIDEVDELWPDQAQIQQDMMTLQAFPPSQGQAVGASPSPTGSRPTRFRRDDGDRSRWLRGGDEHGETGSTINNTRGDRLGGAGGPMQGGL